MSKTKKQRMDHFMKQVCFIKWSILCLFVLLHNMIRFVLMVCIAP